MGKAWGNGTLKVADKENLQNILPLQSCLLKVEVLIVGGNSCVADQHNTPLKTRSNASGFENLF